jgi:hypothetical protein
MKKKKNAHSELHDLINKTLENSGYSIDENHKKQILKRLQVDLENILKKKVLKIIAFSFLLIIIVLIIKQIIN